MYIPVVTRRGTGTWDAGTWASRTCEARTQGREDVRMQGLGNTETRGRGNVGHGNSGTRGLVNSGTRGHEDVIYKQHLFFALNICKAQFLELSRKVLHHFSAREWAEFNKFYNLIGPWSGRNFLIRTSC